MTRFRFLCCYAMTAIVLWGTILTSLQFHAHDAQANLMLESVYDDVLDELKEESEESKEKEESAPSSSVFSLPWQFRLTGNFNCRDGLFGSSWFAARNFMLKQGPPLSAV